MVRLVTLALVVGVFGALAAHHSNDSPVSTAIGTQAAIAPLADSPAAVVAVTAMGSTDTAWLVAAGCGALALCCVLGLAIAKRASPQDRPPLASRDLAPRSTSPRSATLVAPIARPSLLDLSISRT